MSDRELLEQIFELNKQIHQTILEIKDDLAELLNKTSKSSN
ncbi:hypothetical protein QUF49_03380 [Fictibacillus sp. b24]|nr:hypothetical protein [Fictibacillus sp. b24]MDM5315021.1 hypothetical protein [Fictibacillus sp. b24]